MFPHLLLPLKHPQGSYALLSTNAHKQSAIVFVHGFGGDASTTWAQFQSLIDTHQHLFPFYGSCDLYFYSYDSLRTKLPVNADAFGEFLRNIFPRPDQSKLLDGITVSFIPDALRSAFILAGSLIPTEYVEIFLVGHSMGCLVIRAAILNAMRDASDPAALAIANVTSQVEKSKFVLQADPLLNADLTLFAPAIFGSRLPKWLSQALAQIAGIPSAGPLILETLGFEFSSIYDVRCDDEILKEIRENTEDSVKEFPLVNALRSRVMWGAKDKVVEMWQYKNDKPVKYIEKLGHTGVCKPSVEFLDPLAFVVYGREKQTAAH